MLRHCHRQCGHQRGRRCLPSQRNPAVRRCMISNQKTRESWVSRKTTSSRSSSAWTRTGSKAASTAGPATSPSRTCRSPFHCPKLLAAKPQVQIGYGRFSSTRFLSLIGFRISNFLNFEIVIVIVPLSQQEEKTSPADSIN